MRLSFETVLCIVLRELLDPEQEDVPSRLLIHVLVQVPFGDAVLPHGREAAQKLGQDLIALGARVTLRTE